MLNNLPLSDINNWTENIYGDYVFRFNKFMTYEIKNIDETNHLYLIMYKREKGIDSLRRKCLYRNDDLSECMLVANLDAFMFTVGVFEKNSLEERS